MLATGFGLGRLPKMPGTWGSLGGIALAVGICELASAVAAGYAAGIYITACIVVAAAGVWVSSCVVKASGNHDPQYVVIDEISGQMIALVGAGTAWAGPGGWKYLAAGFILFRVFDIWKPFPAKQAERWKGGWGVMADDWVAGGYAAIVLAAARMLLR